MQARLQEPDRFPLRRSESSLVRKGLFSFFLFFIFCLVTRMLDGWLDSEMTKGLEKINGRREGFGRGERGSGRYRMLKPPPRVIITFPEPWYRKPQLHSRKPRGSENLSGASSASTFFAILPSNTTTRRFLGLLCVSPFRWKRA